MTRQTERSLARAAAKADASQAKIAKRKEFRRALLERQTIREKSGFYTGRATAAAISPSRSRLDARKVKKGVAFGRILTSKTLDGREISYHATKGWRSHRAA